MHIHLINLFADLPGEGANEGRFLTLCKVFLQQGHAVTWWTMDFHHRTKQKRSDALRCSAEDALRAANHGAWIKIQMLPVPAYHSNISLLRFRSHRTFARRLTEALHEVPILETPNRIVVSSPPPDVAEAALCYSRSIDCPVMVDLTDLWPHTFTRILPSLLPFRQAFGELVFMGQYRKIRRIYGEADLISAVSREYLDEVQRFAPDQKTHLCYIGGTHCRASEKILSTDQPVQLIYVGAMTGSYDLETALHAMVLLRGQAGPGVHLHFAGSGPNESALVALSQKLGLEAEVSFHGFLNQAELNQLLDRMDVGLNLIRPGLAITMPHKLSDYICAGLPVINSLEGEADQLLQKAHCGRFYRAGHPDSLASAIIGYTVLDDLRQAKAAAAALAAQTFSRSQTYAEWAGQILSLATKDN